MTDSTEVQSAQEPSKRVFACPIFEAENAKGLNHECNGLNANSMAEMRRHIARRHSIFIKLCPTCNLHFIDKHEFENKHGDRGERCRTPQKQKRGDKATKEQWEALYKLILDSQSPSNISGDRTLCEDTTDNTDPVPMTSKDVVQNHHRRPAPISYHTDLFPDTSPPRDPYTVPLDKRISIDAQSQNYYPSPSSAMGYHAGGRLGSVSTSALASASPYFTHTPMQDAEERDSGYPSRDQTRLLFFGNLDSPPAWDNHEMTYVQQKAIVPVGQAANEQCLDDSVGKQKPESVGPATTSRLRCSQCSETFVGLYAKGNLHRHIRSIHTDAEAHELKCRECGRSYKRADARRKHEWKKHRKADARPHKRRMEQKRIYTPGVEENMDTTGLE